MTPALNPIPRQRMSSGPGFAQSFRAQLPYADIFQMNMSLGGVANQNFRLNSVFDPDLSGVGHQPRFFDQISPLYFYYTVVGATAECIIGPAPADNALVLTYLDGSGGTSAASMGGATTAINSELPGTTLDISVNAARPISRTVRAHMPRLLGGGRSEAEYIADTANWTPVTNNPAKVAFWQIQMQPCGTGATINCQAYVKIVFDVVFSGLVPPSTS